MEETDNSEQKEFDLNTSLSDIQRLTAQAHGFYATKASGGEEQYMLLMSLRNVAGDVEFEPITQVDLPDTLENIQLITQAVRASGKAEEGTPLSQSLVKLNEDLKKAGEVFEATSKHKNKKNGLSRRDFLKLAATSAAVAATRAVDTKLMPPVEVNEEGGSSDLENNVNYLKNTYGLEIYTGIPLYGLLHGYSGSSPDSKSLETSVVQVRKAAAMYPKDFFRRNGIEKIIIVTNFKQGGSSLRGLNVASEYVIVNGDYLGGYENTTLHHEWRHALDFGYDFLDHFVSENPSASWNQAYQCSCNPYDPGIDNLELFAREYGKTNNREDRATLSEVLLDPARHKQLIARVASSQPEVQAVLSRKIEWLKHDYYEKSGGAMNDQYWKDLLDGKVVEGYFS